MLAHQIGARYEQARAHDGLAHTHRSVNRARRHWQQALDIYAELEVPEAPAVRAHLRAIADTQSTAAPGPACPAVSDQADGVP